MNSGDKICKKCFEERKKSASKYHEEILANQGFLFPNLLGMRFGVFFPVYFNAVNYLYNKIKYGNSSILYHVYINENHEKWTLHHEDDSNLIKCCKCRNFNNDYFYLYSKD